MRFLALFDSATPYPGAAWRFFDDFAEACQWVQDEVTIFRDLGHASSGQVLPIAPDGPRFSTCS